MANHLETILEVEVPKEVTHAGFTRVENEMALGWINGEELRRFLVEDGKLKDTGDVTILEQPSTKVHMNAQISHDWITLTFDY